MSTALVQISINVLGFQPIPLHKCKKAINAHNPLLLKPEIASSSRQIRFKLRSYREMWSFLAVGIGKYELLGKDGGWKRKRRLVVVRFNQGSGFNGGGDGDKINGRILTNLALAIGLTYLTMTGQLGYVLDAIVSIWLLVVLVPILGLGAFIWWAGRDIVQDSCPNCGNDFQIFKSSLNGEPQICPYCSQPFSVVEDKFVKDSGEFSKQSTTFGQTFEELFSSRSKKGNVSSKAVVDIEAEIKDAD